MTQHDMQVFTGVLEGDDIKQKLQLYKETKSRSLCKLFDTIEEWRVNVTIYTNQVISLYLSLSLYLSAFVCLSVYLYLSVSLPVCLYYYLIDHLHVGLSVYLFLRVLSLQTMQKRIVFILIRSGLYNKIGFLKQCF